MKTRIVRIGNSQGVRIPKPLLEEAGLADDVELVRADDGVLIRPLRAARSGWDQAFEAAAGAAPHCDAPASLSVWDDAEWTW